MIDPVQLTSELVRIPSCDPPGGELAVAQAVARTLRQIGISTELDEFLPSRANVIGRIPGRGEKPALVMSAHLDTVPVGEAW